MSALKRTALKAAVIAVTILLCLAPLAARAGGAGKSSSGDGEGIGFLVYLIIRLMLALPFPWNLVAVSVVLVVFVLFARQKQRADASAYARYKGVPQGRTSVRPGQEKAADAEGLLEKASLAFLEVQKAWSSGDISACRKYISDGVFQRFTTQQKMMTLLKQTNRLSGLKILNLWLDKTASDGSCRISVVGFQAYADDRFESALDRSLNSGGPEEFVEYWTFMKK